MTTPLVIIQIIKKIVRRFVNEKHRRHCFQIQFAEKGFFGGEKRKVENDKTYPLVGQSYITLRLAPMFVERKVSYSDLFTNLVGWHGSAVCFPLSDVILAQLACPLSDIMFCLN